MNRETLRDGTEPLPKSASFSIVGSQSESSGREPENGKFPKVVRRGCERYFEPREQKSPKSLLHHPHPVLHRRIPIYTGAQHSSLSGLKRPFARSPNHFWEFVISGPLPERRAELEVTDLR